MQELVTTILELVAIAAFAIGAGLLVGAFSVGAGWIAGGLVLITASWLLSGAPIPRRERGESS